MVFYIKKNIRRAFSLNCFTQITEHILVTRVSVCLPSACLLTI